MIPFSLISNIVIYGTLQIKTDIGSGTGFLVAADTGDSVKFPLLITNKHVVDGADCGSILVHRRDPGQESASQESYVVSIPDFKNSWIRHDDPEIDLCAFPFWTLVEKMTQDGLHPFCSVTMSSQILVESQMEHLSVLEKIVMIGYPIGLTDIKNNFPIVRQGITASHPLIDFNGKPQFVVDIACFPGSSGSPVFLWDIGNLTREQRVYLIGVLYAGPVMQVDGTIEDQEVPTNLGRTTKSNIMIHLGYVIKGRELLKLIQQVRTKFDIK